MRFALLAAFALISACATTSSPLATSTAFVASDSCTVPYPQLPRCECGCVGELCTTGDLGVVVCGTSERPDAPSILPRRGSAAFSD